jgi:hypothetical protein
MAEQTPSLQSAMAEEDRALDELLSGEQESGADSVKAARADEEAEALEELLSGGSSVTEPVDDDEDQALDDLVAAENDEAIESGQGPDSTVVQRQDDGIITLKEVVALGGVSAEPGSSSVPAVEQPEGMNISGLSREERDDLDKLIKGLKEQPSAGISPAVIADLQEQVKALKKRVVQLTRLVSAYDKKMKACSEIMRLFYQKSAMMNERIDAVADSAKNGKKA